MPGIKNRPIKGMLDRWH